MRIEVISNLVLKPILDELGRKNPDLFISSHYFDDLILSLNSYSPPKDATVLVWFDSYFSAWDEEQQQLLLDAIHQVSERFSNNFIITNNFLKQTSTEALSQRLYDKIPSCSTLYKDLITKENILFLDVIDVFLKIGITNCYNFNLGHLYQMPYTKAFIKEISKSVSSLLRVLSQEEKKVIAVDCDNTLWKGIIGEDGIDGIHFGLNAPGIIFNHFHRFLLKKKAEGFILCLTSKNNEDDVRRVFEHDGILLKWDDFVIKKINWIDKHINIVEIAAELNLNIDSFIFIDDSDFEINAIQQVLPAVHCIQFTQNYWNYLSIIDDRVFQRRKITAEDRQKTRKYQQELERKNAIRSSSSFEEYLKELDIKLDIRINDLGDIDRISQLTGKTNQFNFNKQAYSSQELADAISKKELKIYSLKVQDKFGDYGTVGLALIRNIKGIIVIDNFLLSCRALGRNIEKDFYAFVISDLEKEGLSIDRIIFKGTERNEPAKKFYNSIIYDAKYRENTSSL